jgi:hypothetical protein
MGGFVFGVGVESIGLEGWGVLKLILFSLVGILDYGKWFVVLL